MQIQNMNIHDLKAYVDNPRQNDEAVDKVKESIKEFGFKVPIVVDKNNEIIAGHTRKKAALEIGIKEVPVIVADDLTDEQVRAFRLADNKVAEFSEWDMELLQSELNMLDEIDMDSFGFGDMESEMENGFDYDEDDTEEDEEINPYSLNVDSPVYNINGDKPNVGDLVDTSYADKLIQDIKEKELPKEIENFLIQSSYRHIKFDYKNIAEYYAHADDDVKELMEDSALIIVDYNKAIDKGYVKLTEKMAELAEKDDVDYEG